jgi:pantetheine-phosphate adenylyltransferase
MMGHVAYFAGSFDPPTLGHLELIRRARALADRLVVGVGVHAEKRPWLATEERLALLAELVPEGVTVESFEGLAVDAARRAGATLLVRGVRSEADMAGELAMALANRRLAPSLETVVLIGSPEVAHISSRLVREVAASRGDVSLFVPAPVAEHLARRPSSPGS